MFGKFTIALVAAAMAFVQVRGESHTVTFTNNCGYGTPYLWGPDGVLLSTGSPYTSNGPADGLIAYLQTGDCGNNGEDCTLIEASLNNAGGSSADISLIPPHEFSVTSGFGYYNGCDGAGADSAALMPSTPQTRPGSKLAAQSLTDLDLSFLRAFDAEGRVVPAQFDTVLVNDGTGGQFGLEGLCSLIAKEQSIHPFPNKQPPAYLAYVD
ncbi:uncharacterized protein FIBRA_01905 [Fibroporia radiculosa]|uniref:Uncharacterized protein n=1 Tax=Fibroporia radiculosa TaxID=599839 RepID=J4GLT6_9APHY|nr:uncharacterized protein FIBRA_01905 [Fibroporia radiculosa]CCL99880.1 predicted protein [Fibroporia radiculosa]